MSRRIEKAETSPQTAQLISRQLRNADNARFLRRLPGFELQRELPSQLLDLLCELQETEGTYASAHLAQRDSA